MGDDSVEGDARSGRIDGEASLVVRRLKHDENSRRR